MDKFWKWMEEKGYGFYEKGEHDSRFEGWCVKSDNIQVPFVKPTKQMLIGYMIEYLSLRGIFIGMGTQTSKGRDTMDDYYKRLEDEIKHQASRSKGMSCEFLE